MPCETMGNNFTVVEFFLAQSEILQLTRSLTSQGQHRPFQVLLDVSQQHLSQLLAVCMGWVVEVRTRSLLQKLV